MFLLFLIGEDWLSPNDIPTCSHLSAFAEGLRYYEDSYNSLARGSIEYSDKSNGPVYAYFGCFCAPQSAYYAFYMYAKPGERMIVNGQETHHQDGQECTEDPRTLSLYTNPALYLYKEQCVNVDLQASSGSWGWCVNTHLKFYYRYSYDNWANEHVVNGYTECLACYVPSDFVCRFGYVGPTCTPLVEWDIYCNGNGRSAVYQGSSSIRSDGIGCDCDSHGDNRFCEDTSLNHFPNQNLHTEIREAATTYPEFEGFVSTNDVSDYPYAEIVQTGKLYVPQPTHLKFSIDSWPPAYLKISNSSWSLELGILESQVFCDPEEHNIRYNISSKEKYAKGEYDVELIYHPGCSLNYHYLSVEWIFYLWYGNSPVWEKIPARYLRQ